MIQSAARLDTRVTSLVERKVDLSFPNLLLRYKVALQDNTDWSKVVSMQTSVDISATQCIVIFNISSTQLFPDILMF